jgi:hypothetical protein
MSYDILLVIPRDSETVEEAANRDALDLEPDGDKVAQLAPDDFQARNARAVAALCRLHPGFHKFETESRVELTDLGAGTGLQIYLSEDSGAVSIPYWKQSRSDGTLQLVEQCLRVIAETTEFQFYDPQTGAKLTNENGYRTDPKAIGWGVKAQQRLGKKPWWKFW